MNSMNHDQLVGWGIVAIIINGTAWTCALAHIRTLRNDLSKERLIVAHLRERIEPMHVFGRSLERSAK